MSDAPPPADGSSPFAEVPLAQSVAPAGGDFYIENGCYVFTSAFLARRGWCCGNGCRHCPYEGDAKHNSPEAARADRSDRAS